MYPISLIQNRPFPLIGKSFLQEPFYFSLDDKQLETLNKEIWQDQKELQSYLKQHMQKQQKNWGLCGYLEDRRLLLSDCPQMVQEKRFYHLGIDVILPLHQKLYAAYDAVVQEAYYEAGKGNYGGLVLLKYTVNNNIFYTLYGHLDPHFLPPKATLLKRGDIFARLGDFHENGDWFYHTHIQILTEKAYQQGWISKGYCSKDNIADINTLCPNPLFMLFS